MEMFNKENENVKRAVSGVIIVALILGGIIAGGSLWLLITAAVACISLWEYYSFFESKAHMSRGIGLITALLIFYSSYTETLFLFLGPLFVLTALAILLVELIRRHLTGRSNALWNLGGTLSGIIYICLPWAFIFHLRAFPRGIYFLLTLFLCTWACDVSAYIIGSKWGKKRLSEEVSPNKTWEGFFGGFSGSLLGGVIVAFTFAFPPLPFLTIGLICGIAGQIGDLAESLVKRESGLKDSGSVIPGHGGFLDRFDSILVSGTITYFLFGVIIG